MRLHRFYIAEKIGSKKELAIDSQELVNQISRVFRLGAGDKVVIFDGSGSDFECEIMEDASFNKTPSIKLGTSRDKSPRGVGQLHLVVCEVRPSRYMPTRKVVLYQAVVKKDNFEWIVEKATELGVTDIVPVITERSEKKDLNMERLQKIVVEASEQCGRGDVPVVHSARLNLEEVFANPITEDGLKSIRGIAFHTDGSLRFPSTSLDFTRNKSLGVNNLKEMDGQSLAVFIGPEGGWSPAELEMFHTNNISICSLGKQVLRAETAAVVALSKVLM